MMKKTYIQPETEAVALHMHQQLMVVSGPGASDQTDPGMMPGLDSPMPLSPDDLLGIPGSPLGL